MTFYGFYRLCVNFHKVWRSKVHERPWRFKGVCWKVLVCLSVIRQVLRVCFGWNSCGRSSPRMKPYLELKLARTTPHRTHKWALREDANLETNTARQWPNNGLVEGQSTRRRPIDGSPRWIKLTLRLRTLLTN